MTAAPQSIQPKRFSLRLFALGVTLGTAGAIAGFWIYLKLVWGV